jgi:hypothetical protein
VRIILLIVLVLGILYLLGRSRHQARARDKAAQFERLAFLLSSEMRSWEKVSPAAWQLLEKGQDWAVAQNVGVIPELGFGIAKAALAPLLLDRIREAMSPAEYQAWTIEADAEQRRLNAQMGKARHAFEQWWEEVEDRYETVSKKAAELGVLS